MLKFNLGDIVKFKNRNNEIREKEILEVVAGKGYESYLVGGDLDLMAASELTLVRPAEHECDYGRDLDCNLCRSCGEHSSFCEDCGESECCGSSPVDMDPDLDMER